MSRFTDQNRDQKQKLSEISTYMACVCDSSPKEDMLLWAAVRIVQGAQCARGRSACRYSGPKLWQNYLLRLTATGHQKNGIWVQLSLFGRTLSFCSNVPSHDDDRCSYACHLLLSGNKNFKSLPFSNRCMYSIQCVELSLCYTSHSNHSDVCLSLEEHKAGAEESEWFDRKTERHLTEQNRCYMKCRNHVISELFRNFMHGQTKPKTFVENYLDVQYLIKIEENRDLFVDLFSGF